MYKLYNFYAYLAHKALSNYARILSIKMKYVHLLCNKYITFKIGSLARYFLLLYRNSRKIDKLLI
jgi:hypothetical protein